jgi:tellurite resistance protein
MTYIEQLHKVYCIDRNNSLTVDQFTSFLAFFPVLLVAAADGVVDENEWEYCRRLASSLAYSYSDELSEAEINQLTQAYQTEFSYLLTNLKQWQERFLEALEEFFSINKYAKVFVAQTAWLVAAASDGVSQTEKMKMQELAERFSLKLKEINSIDLLRESLGA